MTALPGWSGHRARAALDRHWTDRSLRVKGLVILLLPLLSLFGALLWVSQTTRFVEEAARDVQMTLQAQESLEHLEALLDFAALTAALSAPGPDPVAAPAGLTARLPGAIDDLQASIDDPAQRERLVRLRRSVDRLLSLMRSTADGSSRNYDAMEVVLAVSALRPELSAMRQHATALLTESMARAEEAHRTNMVVFGAASGLGVLGAAAAALLFFTGVVRRVRALQGNAERLARGEPLASAVAAGDEIGALAVAIHRASALLSHRQRRLEDLIARQFEAQEEERRRVAYDLHDGLAQVAAAAHQHLQAYAGRYPPAEATARDALDRGLALVQRTVGETRAVIAGLRPTALDDFGLESALEAELATFRAEGRTVELSGTIGATRPPPVVETVLFRIVQEALNNVRKHAGRDARVRVTLECEADTITITVADDGRGFDASAPDTSARRSGERIGLEAIKERASMIGAAVSIESRPGAGTVVSASVPLNAGGAVSGDLRNRRSR